MPLLSRLSVQSWTWKPLIIAWAVAILVGCESEAERKLNQWRTRLLVSAEPAYPVNIEQIAKAVPENGEVTIAGRINAGKSDPFEKGKATLIMGELPEPGHDHAPDDDCPFCRRKLEESQHCLVRFLDESGNVLPYGAQELFGVQNGQDVVVVGKATMLADLGILQLDASQIYVRPNKPKSK